MNCEIGFVYVPTLDFCVPIPTDEEWKDYLRGGLADKKFPSDFDIRELTKGIEVELEHTDDVFIAAEIAMDHLTESGKYYEYLKLMERRWMK